MQKTERIFSKLILLFQLSILVNGDKRGVRCGLLKELSSSPVDKPDGVLCADCLFPDNCLSNDTCRLGTSGSMCEQCFSNERLTYYRVGSVCIQCPDVPYWTAICFTIFILIFLGCFLLHGFSKSMSTKVKVLVHYLQFLVLSVHIKLAWPNILLRAVSTLNFGVFNSSIILPGCLFTKLSRMTVHYLEWYSSLCVPVLVLIVGLMVDKRFKVLISRAGRNTEEANERRLRKMDQRLKLRRFACLVILVMYMPALVSCMRTLQCSGTVMKDLVLDKSKDVFLLDTEYSCRTSIFQMTHFLAVLYLVVLILYTLLVLFFTVRQRKWKLLDKDSMLYSPIYESYKDKFCFWEAVILLRKLVSVIVTESHPIKPLWQVTIQLGMTAIYVLLLIILRPYRSCYWTFPKLNNHILFEVLSNISVFLLQVAGLSIITGQYKEEYSYIVIISMAAILIVWLVLMAAMKCETETETHLTELSQDDLQEIAPTSSQQASSCLPCCKKNRVEPDLHLQDKIQERKQKIDF